MEKNTSPHDEREYCLRRHKRNDAFKKKKRRNMYWKEAKVFDLNTNRDSWFGGERERENEKISNMQNKRNEREQTNEKKMLYSNNKKIEWMCRLCVQHVQCTYIRCSSFTIRTNCIHILLSFVSLCIILILFHTEIDTNRMKSTKICRSSRWRCYLMTFFLRRQHQAYTALILF